MNNIPEITCGVVAAIGMTGIGAIGGRASAASWTTRDDSVFFADGGIA